MNKFIFCIIMIVASMSADAQSFKAKGQVCLADKHDPLPYAVIRNCNTDDVVFSDSLGYFEIPVNKGDSLVCSYIGCTKQTVTVSDYNEIKFFLIEDNVSLEDVEIVGKKRPIEISHNGFTVNLQSIRKDGKLLSDLLQQIPLITVKDNNISMAGKKEILVYLNNHRVYLKGDELMAYLNTLGIDNVRSFQIYSTPPSQYEADGNIGILKIETTKNINPGLQSNLLGKGEMAHNLSCGASAKILYSEKNYSIENTLLASYANAFAHSHYTNAFDDCLVSTECPRTSKEKVVMTLTTLSIDLNARNNISATLQLPWYNNVKNRDIANDTRYIFPNNTDADSVMSSVGHGNSADYQASCEVNYTHVFSEKTNLNMTLGYINSYERNYREWNSKTITTLNEADEDFYSAGHQKYDIYTMNVDVSNTLKGWKLTEGYKFSYTHATAYNEEDERLTSNAASSNLFGYRETNNALYVNAESSVKSVLLNLGLRAELTYTKGISHALEGINRNHYFRLFPVVDIEYMLDNNNTLCLNYSGRVKRPDYQLLDPFRWYVSKYDYSEGNPFLEPSYIHNVYLSYLRGSSLYAKLYFTKTDKDFSKMVFLDKDNIQNQIERAGNFLNISSFGLDAEYNFHAGAWLESSLTGNVTYSSYSSNHPTFMPIKGWGCTLSMNNTFFLNNKFSASMYIEDDVPGYYDYRKTRNSLLLNVGVSYMDRKRNLTVSVRAEDLFKNASPKYSYYSNGIKQDFNNYYDSRKIEITVVKRIGNLFNKSKNHFQSSNTEEKERL
jgi:hypothetical protein